LIQKIDHIGIAVTSIKEALPYYRDILGLEYTDTQEVAGQKVRVAFLKIGESRIELLEPTGPDSPLAKFLEARGAGLHHIAVKVSDIQASLSDHKKAGLKLIDDEPRMGAHNMKIAFVHPNATSGVLLELCQRP